MSDELLEKYHNIKLENKIEEASKFYYSMFSDGKITLSQYEQLMSVLRETVNVAIVVTKEARSFNPNSLKGLCSVPISKMEEAIKDIKNFSFLLERCIERK